MRIAQLLLPFSYSILAAGLVHGAVLGSVCQFVFSPPPHTDPRAFRYLQRQTDAGTITFCSLPNFGGSCTSFAAPINQSPRWTPLSVTLCRASTLREVTEDLCALFAGMLCSLFSSLFLSFIFFVLSEYTRNLPALLGQLMSFIFIDRTDMCADINNPNACESFRAPMETLPSSLTENVHSYLCIDF